MTSLPNLFLEHLEAGLSVNMDKADPPPQGTEGLAIACRCSSCERIRHLEGEVERLKGQADLHAEASEINYANHQACEARASLMEEALRGLLDALLDTELPINDCIDNHGGRYQSQYLADKIEVARTALNPPGG